MKYGKLTDGALKTAPNPLCMEDITISNPTEEQYREAGYLPVIYTDPPEQEGYYPVCFWEETETEIVQNWRLEPMPEPDAGEEDLLEALEELGVTDEEETA